MCYIKKRIYWRLQLKKLETDCMPNMNFVSSVKTKSLARVFSDSNYEGTEVVLARGEYSGSSIVAVKSVKVADFSRISFYEMADGSGKCVQICKDTAELALDFAVQVIVVETYAKGVKEGQETALEEGEYAVEELKAYDKLIVPRGFYAVFAGNAEDEHTVRIFENEECLLDKVVDDYEKVLLFTLGSDDVRINFGIKEELLDEELAYIAGGKTVMDGECGINYQENPCQEACGQNIKR